MKFELLGTTVGPEIVAVLEVVEVLEILDELVELTELIGLVELRELVELVELIELVELVGPIEPIELLKPIEIDELLRVPVPASYILRRLGPPQYSSGAPAQVIEHPLVAVTEPVLIVSPQ